MVIPERPSQCLWHRVSLFQNFQLMCLGREKAFNVAVQCSQAEEDGDLIILGANDYMIFHSIGQERVRSK